MAETWLVMIGMIPVLREEMPFLLWYVAFIQMLDAEVYDDPKNADISLPNI